jgi:hypothetical protein
MVAFDLARPLWHAELMPISRFDDAVIEMAGDRLRFSGESASLVKRLAPLCDGNFSLLDISRELNTSVESVSQHLEILEENDVVLDISIYAQPMESERAIIALRKAARFYNIRVMANKTVRKLFSGVAGDALAMGYAIEFYFYVASVTKYMAMGSSRFDYPIEVMEPYLRHFAEEANHSQIFHEGLVACGVPTPRLKASKALATTSALTDFLFERSSRSLVEYGSLFAIMQPNARGLTRNEVVGRYDEMRSAYPNMKPVWESFQKHDLIDVDASHNSWALETHINIMGGLSKEEMLLALRTMRDAACFFIIFLDGIRDYYDCNIKWKWRYQADCEVE